MNKLRKHIRKYEGVYSAGAAFLLPIVCIGTQLGIQGWRNAQWKDLEQGFRVAEYSGNRHFYLENGRFALDKNKDGSLDKILVNRPISPMMGGSGYAAWSIEITDEDRNRFARANDLLKNLEKNKNDK